MVSNYSQPGNPQLPAPPNTPVGTVVVYAARLHYPNVLAHIFPGQVLVRDAVADWARALPGSRPSYVVLAHMPRESEEYDLPASPNRSPSVRNERIDLILKGIGDAGLESRCFETPDYAAAHAYDLVNKFSDALGWVCLSDELSVGVLQTLEARGVSGARRRIIGFDDSTLARRHSITSFTQHVPDIGKQLAETFASFFRGTRVPGSAWPEFVEKTIPVELVRRCARDDS